MGGSEDQQKTIALCIVWLGIAALRFSFLRRWSVWLLGLFALWGVVHAAAACMDPLEAGADIAPDRWQLGLCSVILTLCLLAQWRHERLFFWPAWLLSGWFVFVAVVLTFFWTSW